MDPDTQTRETMQAFGQIINDNIPPGWGFGLFVFPLEDRSGNLNYIASCKREPFLEMLKNFIKNSEQHPKSFGSHDTLDLPPV